MRRVGSFELSAGQMIDDVRIGVAGRAPVDVHRRRVDRPLRLRRRAASSTSKSISRTHPRAARRPRDADRSPATTNSYALQPHQGRRPMTAMTTPDRPGARHDDRAVPARATVEALKPDLLLTQEHHMCPGCGEPLAVRQFLETIAELDAVARGRSRSRASAATRRSRARWTSTSCRRCTAARRRSRPA